MENHPIPQDVTGFQFKLVGNMTLKQFGFVGVGVVLCVVFFYAPINFLIKFPLVMITGLGGVALAFLQVEGRPLDVMAANLLKAFILPNQFVYQKVGGRLSFNELELQAIIPPKVQSTTQTSHATPTAAPDKEQRLREFLYDMSATPSANSNVDEREAKYLTMFAPQMPSTPPPPMPASNPLSHFPLPQMAPHPAQPQMTPATPPLPAFQYPVQPQTTQTVTPQARPQPVLTAQPMPVVQPTPPQPIITAQPTMPQPVATAAVIPQAPTPLQPMTAPQVPMQPMSQASIQTVQIPPLNTPVQGVPGPKAPAASEFPNLVSGIVKDPRGNVLGGILIEVKNKSGESVRAFKTNALGQFASATQLTNGSYTIEFEDPKSQHTFNKIPVEATGSIIPPFEVVSVDAREELRRELFG